MTKPACECWRWEPANFGSRAGVYVHDPDPQRISNTISAELDEWDDSWEECPHCHKPAEEA